MRVLGIIPARGGSKSLPLKNIKELCGKPLILYTIEAVTKTQLVTRLIVSTDNEHIAKISEGYGCEVIRRPSALATDTSPTEDALIHALETLKQKENFWPDIVLTLEPTSPFRTPDLIDRCIKIFEEEDVDSVIGVVESRSPYWKMAHGRFEPLFSHTRRPRQDRELLYQEKGTIYATHTDILIRKKSVIGDKLFPMVVSEQESIDINTMSDFHIAEALMKMKIRG